MKLLKELTQCWGPSGSEEQVRELISSVLSEYTDELKTDALGNLIARKKGSGKKVMFAAHMDEVGIIVTYIDEQGYIRFSSVGGLTVKQLAGRRVQFKNGTVGIIGCEDEAFSKKAAVSKLYIDIGESSREAVEQLVHIGDSAVFTGEFYETGRGVVSKALDNRSGCYILLEAVKQLKYTENDLYFVFTVQEEVGLRGAKTAGFSVDADIAVNVDVTDTGDTPSAPAMAVKLGKGAAIKVMDSSIICDSMIRETMLNLAKKNNIPYQLEVMQDGGTDAGQIHLARAGIKTGGVSIPLRYMHSPSEMLDCTDLQACIHLLSALMEYTW